MANVPASAWIDYVAFVSLAQINPEAESLEVPAILNLSTSPVDNTPAGMTDWDVASLHGL